MNKCFHIGNLAKDPEERQMANGKKCCSLTVAVQRQYSNAQGIREADFIQFVAFEKRAEMILRYLAKGRKVAIESHVKTGSYEKDGQRIYRTDFIVDNIEFLSSGQSSDHGQAPTADPGPSAPPTYPQSFTGNEGFTAVDDDELPF